MTTQTRASNPYLDDLQAKIELEFLQGLADYQPDYLKGYLCRFTGPGAAPLASKIKLDYLGGLGTFAEVGEGADVTELDVGPEKYKELSYIKLAKTLKWTYESEDDDPSGRLMDRVRALSGQMQIAFDTKVVDYWNHAITGGAGYLGADGAALCATHTLPSGGTYTNNLTVALDSTNLGTAIQRLWETPDDYGKPFPCKPTHLLVPPALWNTAAKLLSSNLTPQTVISNEQPNAINPLNGIGITPIMVQGMGAAFGGSDTRWFVIDANRFDVRFFHRAYLGQGVLIEESKSTTKQVREWTFSARCAIGHSDFRGVVGSIP